VKKRHTDQVAELDDEISKARRELHTGEQDRTVTCNEYFRRAEDGTGFVHTIRMDTGEEVERRPANPAETQRYLPSLDPPAANAPLLDQAVAAQGKAAAGDAESEVGGGGDTEEPDDEDDDGPEDDGLTELTPAQKAAKDAGAMRKARRAEAKAKSGKGKAK
jgi:hypothetical protein